jgi:hypothetical protein
MTLDVGSSYTASLAVVGNDGKPASPSAATLTWTLPDQTTVTGNVPLPPAVPGLVVADPFVSTQGGLHRLAWATTGPVVTKTDYLHFRSYRSAISLDDARDRLGLTKTNRDEQVRNLAGVATRLVENKVGILVPRTFADEFVPGTTRDIIRVQNGPIFDRASVTSLKSAYPGGPSWNTGDANTITGGQLIIGLRPGTLRLSALLPFWYGPWLVSYKAGWNGEIPEPVIEAVREVLFDLWSQYRGLTADIAEAAGEMAMVVPPYYRLPARALAMIKDFELPGFG